MHRPLDPQAVDRTGRLMSRARRVLAYGGLDGIVQRPLLHGEGVFPQFAVGAEGCRLVDSTGQIFVDWVNGWGPVLLGYRHPAVERALAEQLAAGPTLSLMHPVEVEVAETLVECVPCAEMVAFGKNGSDVLTAAVRVARAVTGRQLVLHYGMHGFHDWFVCSLPGVQGMPEGLHEAVRSFPYDDLGALEALLTELEGQVAAVLMEPVREVLPSPGYLQGVQELLRRHGALLVFDEVVTALRLGPGGAQDVYGVAPDLACLGKSLGNGMPLSALVGRRAVMQRLPSVGFGMTFRGETLSLAAARAVLKVVREEPVAEHLAAVGERLRRGFAKLVAPRGLDWELSGPPARLSVRFAGAGGMRAEDLRDLFLQECLKRGVFTNGNFLPSYAHDDAAVDETLAGVEGALDVVVEAVTAGEVGDLAPVGGFPHGPRAHVAQGFLDRLAPGEGGWHLEGWLLLGDGAPDALAIEPAGGEPLIPEPVERADLGAAFPHLARATDGGFRALVPGEPGGDLDVALVAHRGGREAYRCRVVARAEGDAERERGPYWLGDGVLYL